MPLVLILKQQVVWPEDLITASGTPESDAVQPVAAGPSDELCLQAYR